MEYSIGEVEYATGRRLLNAYKYLEDQFILLYGDNYWPIELESMVQFINKLNTSITTTVFSNRKGTGEYGFENNILVSPEGLVKYYDKKRETNNTNGVDIGYFIVKKESLNPEMSGNLSFEEDILPKFIYKNQLAGYITHKQYYFITNKKTLKDFEIAADKYNILPLHKSFFKFQ